MAETATIRKLTSLTAGSGERMRRIGSTFLRALTFSAADDLIFPQKNLAVSIEKGGLSIAYGSRFLSGITVRKTKEVAFEEERYPQPEEMAASIALAANEFGASRDDVTLGIPKAWTIIRTAEFPSGVKENLAAVVSYELDRLTPFAAEDAFFDFRLLSEEGGKISVLIVAARADVIQPYLSTCAERGVTVDRVAVTLWGFGTLCRGAKGDPDIAFLKIDAKEYEGAWFSRGSMPRTFSGSMGASSEVTVRGNAIVSEITSLLETAKTMDRSPHVTVFLTGNDPALVELLKMRIAAPLTFLRASDTGLKFQGDPAKATAFSAVGVLAESLQTRERRLNLLSKGVQRQQKPPIGITVVLAAAVLAALVAYLITPLRVEQQKLSEITRQLSSKREEVKKVEDLKKEVDSLNSEIESINNFKGRRPLDLDMLKELTTVLPKNTWLTRCRITEDEVNIEGYAASATELLPKLEASPYFQKVEFASPTFRDARMNADRFVIKMEIENAKKPVETASSSASGQKKTEEERSKNAKK